MKRYEPSQHHATKVGLDIMLQGGTSPDHVNNLVNTIQGDLKAKGINVPDGEVIKGTFLHFKKLI